MVVENATPAQCVHVSATMLLVAMPDGRSWLTNVGTSSITTLPVSAIAAERLSVAASLVEGAIAAGLAGSKQARSTISYTLPRYIRWLAGNYIFAGQTPGLFRRAAERFEAAGRRDLATFACQKADEEEGHANLAYRDLEGLGLPAVEVIRLLQPPSAEVFADRFRSYVESTCPIALFGFSYCLERMAVGRDEAFIRKIEAVCPPKSRAYRFLKVHSNIGADSTHVDEQLSFFESLTVTELAAVTCAAYETAALLGHQPLMDEALSDEEMERRLLKQGFSFHSPHAKKNGQREIAT